ncbi:MAG: FixH family protein [Vicinamibacterales bacterium]
MRLAPWRPRYRLTRYARRLPAIHVSALALAAALSAVACTRPQPAHDDVVVLQLTLTPAAPRVGTSALAEVTVRSPGNRPVTGARMTVDARMLHPGMAPVIEPAVDHGDGRYTAAVYFSMAGSWSISATGTLPDGRSIDRQLSNVTVRPPD